MMIDTVIRSRTYLLPASDIDTDQIFPSRFTNRVDGASDLSNYFFHDQRFDAEGRPNAEAALNNPALKGACILVSPRNYACGSARPGAVFAHRDFGIRVLISESFGQVFPTVCYKFGVVPIEVPRSDMALIVDCLSNNPLTRLEIDFAKQEIKVGRDLQIPFDLDEHVRTIAISGQDELGLTLTYTGEIERYEAERSRTWPWLMG